MYSLAKMVDGMINLLFFSWKDPWPGIVTFALAGAFVWLVYRWWISFWLCSLFCEYPVFLYAFQLSLISNGLWLWTLYPSNESWFLIFAFWLLISFFLMTLSISMEIDVSFCLIFQHSFLSCRLLYHWIWTENVCFCWSFNDGRFWWTTFPCASFPLEFDFPRYFSPSLIVAAMVFVLLDFFTYSCDSPDSSAR